ncbi:MAG: Zn-dependent exopeptidase M28 [Treponema sp.]|nr:Zn-dependent exopeptidase M28 [Treponema sp.]
MAPKSLPAGFENYIAPDCDRLTFLQDYLAEWGVESSVIPLAGRKHLYVNFPSQSYNPLFKIKTVITHYDRVPGSPGANDNSAANLMIADWAGRLASRVRLGGGLAAHNVRIFFTDGEELGENGVNEQGAFALAELFRKLGITRDDVYVFDACGRGTVPVLARAGLDALKKTGMQFKKQFVSLYKRTEELLRTACPENWLTLPVPYSDNAGFLACGIPAVAVTMLPADEASSYMRCLMNDKNLEREVMNSHTHASQSARERFHYEEMMPKTWRLFHTEYDNLLSLSEESFIVMARILDTLADAREMA